MEWEAPRVISTGTRKVICCCPNQSFINYHSKKKKNTEIDIRKSYF